MNAYPKKIVRLLIDPSTGFSRELIRGVSRYARERAGWTVLFEWHVAGTPYYASRHADGILARFKNTAYVDVLRQAQVPTILLSGSPGNEFFPSVGVRGELIAGLAADHLYGCGFRQFAFCGFGRHGPSASRQKCFVASLQQRGWPCAVYNTSTGRRPRDLAKDLERLAAWLSTLEPHTGLFASSDLRAYHVMLAARNAGLEVPSQLGVIGVDDEHLLSDLCPVPLSSIDPDASATGYRAAALLDEWMTHNNPPPQRTACGQPKLIRRRSTQVQLVDDEMVRLALARLETQDALPQTVSDLIEGLPVSRRPFERRFKQALGVTPNEVLKRTKLDRAEQLLTDTDWTLDTIAMRCGFSLGHHLATAMRRERGETPGAFRRRVNQPENQ